MTSVYLSLKKGLHFLWDTRQMNLSLTHSLIFLSAHRRWCSRGCPSRPDHQQADPYCAVVGQHRTVRLRQKPAGSYWATEKNGGTGQIACRQLRRWRNRYARVTIQEEGAKYTRYWDHVCPNPYNNLLLTRSKMTLLGPLLGFWFWSFVSQVS